MSENDKNEQPVPPPTDPSASTPSAADGPTGDAEHHVWRAPSEPEPGTTPPAVAPPTSATAPGAPGTPAAETVPIAGPASGPGPVGAAQYPTTPPPYATPGAAAQPPAGYPTAGYVAGDYPTTGQGATTGGPAMPPTYPGAPESTTAGFPTAGGYPTSAYPAYPGAAYPTASDAKPPRSHKAGAIAGIAALALALVIGGGVVGGLVTHQVEKDDRGTVNANGVVTDNAPIVDRSSLASIASKVSPSVVSITTQNAEGSGVVLSADGYILTNNHVAATASGQTVDVTFTSGKTVKATLVGTDPKTDLAVYKAENATGLPAATFGNSGALQVGDTVLAIGSPLGLDGSVSAGIVSALNRTIDESADNNSPQDPFGQGQQQQNTSPTATIAGAIQTDAAINPGNSGGALVNTNGEVVGINTAIATNGADGNIGVGFAIPSNRAKQVADDIIKGVAVSHPQLGVGVTTADDNAGALVGSVTAGSAADKAGLKVGDVITGFDGTAVHTSDDLLNDVQNGTVGKSVALTVSRNGSPQTINVTLGEAK